MEYDRYQQNHNLFIVSMICLILSMALFAFSVYIAPALIWDVHYDIPLLVIDWKENLHLNHEFTERTSAWIVFFAFFIPACIAGYIAYLTSNQLENEIYHIKPQRPDPTIREERTEHLRQSTGFGLKIILLILMVVMLTTFIPWFFSATLSTTAPTNDVIIPTIS